MQPNLAKQFISQLENQGLLAPDVIDELRRQAAESKSRLTPEIIAKLLIDNGHLTKFQATKLIAELKASSAPAASKAQPDLKKSAVASDEDLGFAPDADSSSVHDESSVYLEEPEARPTEIIAEEVVNEVAVVEVVDADPVASVAKRVRNKPKPSSIDSMLDDVLPTLSTQIKRPKIAKANPFDSFRILGVGIILALVLIAGIWLIFWFIRGNASENLERANTAYEQRSYETASKIYKEFAQNFGSDPKASFAKVRSALATLRKDTEGAADPNVGLQTALAVLPPISGESALSAEQGDLVDVLVILAGKFNERADGFKETAQKKALMAEMDKLMELINNPQYVGTNQRNQQLPTLNRIEEHRKRIQLDINRDEELAKTLTAISEQLADKKTTEAYQLRKELIARYPQLETDAGLIAQVQKASVIQQSLVAATSSTLKLAKEAPAPQPRQAIVLANRSGKEAPTLKGRTLFVRVKGSVYGLDGGTGNVLWRYYVGPDFVDDPIRLRDTASSDLLICRTDSGHFARLDGASGKIKWHIDVGSAALRASVDGEDAYIAARDGMLTNIDVGHGQTKWAVKLPQLIETPAGVSAGKPHLYIPGDHSNLYVLARQDGSCKEVYYLGHRKGTIAIPPMLVLGQLFVFENAGADFANIRILQTSDSGLQLAAAQAPIQLKGNIVVPPLSDGRRLIVLTDLGEVAVLDVEPTAAKEKVSTIASIRASEPTPRPTWAIVDRNALWTASNRFVRYEIQVSKSQIAHNWTKEPGDQFTAPPQKFDDVIVHSRTVRGTQGIRVAAVSAQTCDPMWQTDLGVPISAILEAGLPGKFDALSTSGTLFTIDTQPIRNSADENPEEGKPSMLYRDPEPLAGGSQVMLNASIKNRFAVYKQRLPKRMQTLAANFGGAEPTCPPTGMGDKFVVGLSNGQLIAINPANGSVAGSPFQLTMKPGQRVKWNQPAYLENSQTLVVTSDMQKLMRIGVGDALKRLSEVDLEQPMRGALVAVGSKVLGVSASQTSDNLHVFDSTSLKQDAVIPLSGRVITGPYSVADRVLVQTESKVEAVDASGKVLWVIDFPKSRVVGKPALVGENIVLASASGQIWLIDPKSGATVASMAANHPLSAVPLVVARGLLLGSDEGCVLVMPPLNASSGTKP